MVFGSGVAEASPLAVDAIVESAASVEELPKVEQELLVNAEASVPTPFIIQFSPEFEVAFSVLLTSIEPEPEAQPDLACERGCVLEYNACMWTEYDMACEDTLDICASTCE